MLTFSPPPPQLVPLTGMPIWRGSIEFWGALVALKFVVLQLPNKSQAMML